MPAANDSFDDSLDDESWFYSKPPPRPASSQDDDDDVHSPSPKRSRPEKTSPVYIKVRPDTLVEKSRGELVWFAQQRTALGRLMEMRKLYPTARCFSEEKGEDGARQYIVCTPARCWEWYARAKERHLYELIEEGQACRPYFDLEYSKESNPSADPLDLIRRFVRVVGEVVEEMYGMELDEEKSWLLLDSSTEKKMSCHAILHLPERRLFPSATAMRPLVARVEERLREDPACVLQSGSGDKTTTIMDTAVYTKNRNFRMFLSSKRGKTACLRVADYCKFYGRRFAPDHEVFYDSLCVPVDWRQHALVEGAESEEAGRAGSEGAAGEKGGRTSREGKVGSGPSPFPHLDEFMLGLLRKWRDNVWMRQWKEERDGEGKLTAIVYYPANCRYCFNIGREHKSNGCFWTVSFVRWEFVQRCFDPECRGTSSNHFPLPKPIRESLEKQMSGTSPADGDESILEESLLEVSHMFTEWDNVFDC